MSHRRPFFFFISLRAFPFPPSPPLLFFFGKFPACTQHCQALQPLHALRELSAAGETEEMATLRGCGFSGSGFSGFRVLPAPSGYMAKPTRMLLLLPHVSYRLLSLGNGLPRVVLCAESCVNRSPAGGCWQGRACQAASRTPLQAMLCRNDSLRRTTHISKSRDLHQRSEQPGTAAARQHPSESPFAPLGMLGAELSPSMALPVQQAACAAPGDS